MKRDKYYVSGNVCEHTFVDSYGRERVTRYWVRDGGGYVWFVNAHGQNTQPAHPGGETWRAMDGEGIRDLCKAHRRRWRREGGTL